MLYVDRVRLKPCHIKLIPPPPPTSLFLSVEAGWSWLRPGVCVSVCMRLSQQHDPQKFSKTHAQTLFRHAHLDSPLNIRVYTRTHTPKSVPSVGTETRPPLTLTLTYFPSFHPLALITLPHLPGPGPRRPQGRECGSGAGLRCFQLAGYKLASLSPVLSPNIVVSSSSSTPLHFALPLTSLPASLQHINSPPLWLLSAAPAVP